MQEAPINRPKVVRPPIQRPGALAPIKIPESKPVEPPKPEGFSVLETLKNSPGSFYKNLKEAVNGLIIEPSKSAFYYLEHPSEYLDDWKKVPKALPLIWDSIKDDYTDYYGNAAERIQKDPFRLIGDIATVGTVGLGAAEGLAKVGGAANLATKLGKAGTIVGNIDPLGATLTAAGKVPRIGKWMTAAGEGKYTSELNSLKARISQQMEQLAFSDASRVWWERTAQADRETLTNLFVWGDNAELSAAKATRPDLWKKYSAMREYLLEDEKLFVDAQKFITKPEAETAKAKGMVRWAVQKGKPLASNENDALALAKKMISEGKNSPTFFRIFSQSGIKNDPFDMLQGSLYRGGVLSRAEKRAMKGEIPTDPDIILANHIKTSRELQGKLKMMEALKESMAQKGEWKVIRQGDDTTELSKAGYAPFQGPFYERYFTAMKRGSDAVAEALTRPGDKMDNVVQASKAFMDRELVAQNAALTGDVEVWVPKHVAAWANLEFNPGASDHWLGKAMRHALNMGGFLPYYKSIVTVLNPRYWLPVIVGNSVLAMFYGLSPSAMKYAIKFNQYLPPEIKALRKHTLFKLDMPGFFRFANSWQEAAQMFDQYFKGGMYVQEAYKEAVKRNLTQSAFSFFKTAEEAKSIIKYFTDASKGEPELLARLTQVKQVIANNATGYFQGRQQYDRLEKGEAAMRARMAKTEIRNLQKAGEQLDINTANLEILENELARNWNDVNTLESVSEKYLQIATDPNYKLPPPGLQKWISELPERKGAMEAAEWATPKNRASARNELRTHLAKLKEKVRLEKQLSMIKAKTPANARLLSNTRVEIKNLRNIIDGDKYWVKKYSEQVFNPQGALDTFDWKQDVLRVYKGYQELIARQLKPKVARLKKAIEKAKLQMPLGSYGKASFSNQLKALDRIEQLKGMVKWGMDQELAATIDAMVHSGQLYKQFPDIARDAAVADRFIQVANSFYGSYARLSPFERTILRQFVPFYTFNKAMTKLAFKLPFMFPRRAFIYMNIWRAWEDIMEDETPNSSWVRDYAIIGAEEDGNPIAVRVGSLNPFNSLRTTPVGPLEAPSIFDIFGQNPVIKITLDTLRGKMTPKPLTPGSKQVRLANGEVWEWTGRGFKRVMPVAPYLKYLYSLFPQSQILDAMVVSAVQTDRGWLMQPDPILGSRGAQKGKPAYPIGTREKLVTWAIPATKLNLEELKKREKGKWRRIISEYRDEYNRSGPVKRENIKRILMEARAYSGKKYLEY